MPNIGRRPDDWEQRWANRDRVKHYSEVQRIVQLPTAGNVSPARAEELSKQNVLAPAYEAGFRLLPDQANGLHAFLATGCGFFSIKVGGGKTALSMLIASHYHRKRPDQKILLLIPASISAQFFLRDLPWARSNLALCVPWFNLGGSTRKKRLTLARSGRPGCYVLPYSCLSTEDTIEVLREIDASLVIADEAQLLRGKSAKTKRWWAYVNKVKPNGVAMSGTLTTRTPLEYHELMRWCMGKYSPLPHPKVEAAMWSKLLMSGAADPTPEEIQEITPLLNWAKTPATTAGFRDAYRQRLHTAPSFYSSGDKELGVALELANSSPGNPSDHLKDLVKRTAERWIHPCGDILSYGIELHATLRELSAGFYYNRVWPEDHPLVDQAIERHNAGQDYYRTLRDFFGSTRLPREGLDTPLAVGKYHLDHGPIRGWENLYDLWKEWHALDNPDLPERLSIPVWIDNYKIKHATKWAEKLADRKKGGIIWCIHRAVMDRLLEALTKKKIKCMRKGSGDTWLKDDGSESYIVVASISAHGTGKNLQAFQHQLILQWPRSATVTEQLLGRTHRTGQKAERLVVTTNFQSDWDYEQLACTLQDTNYQHETLGGRQKLLIADWNPVPRNLPVELLRRRGWRVDSR